MLLHRYFCSHAVETLKEGKLKTSRITSFNDPFEFLYVTKGKITAKMAREYVLSRRHEPEFLQCAAKNIPGLLTASNPQKLLEKRIPLMVANIVKGSEKLKQATLQDREQIADKSTRVICFSNSNINPLDEILLWSHYAKSHEGIRLGFEFPDGIKDRFKISKVKYQASRFAVDFSLGITSTNIGQALVDSAKVKSLAWQYEHEYRLLTHPSCCEQRTMPDGRVEYFLAFEREWVKSIDFGVRCPQTLITSLLDLIKASYSNTILRRKAVFHESEYELEYETMVV